MVSNDARAAQLFLTHHSFVRGMALRHAPWPGLAEDIIQQTFVEFLAKSAQWNLDEDIRPLLAAMTRTVALRNWREKARTLPEVTRKLAEHIRQLAEEQTTPPRYDEELNALRSCLEKLPEKSRTLVNLYYYGDVSTPEIASQLEMKSDTVCRALGRLREKLRDCIDLALKGGTVHA